MVDIKYIHIGFSKADHKKVVEAAKKENLKPTTWLRQKALLCAAGRLIIAPEQGAMVHTS